MQRRFSRPTNQDSRFGGGFPVPDVKPIDGWELFSIEVEDGDGFWRHEYFARGADRDVHLDLSRNRFTPSQDRFAWLVRSNFPQRPSFGPWDDTDIEYAIAAEQVAA